MVNLALAQGSALPHFNSDQRAGLARAVINLFDQWHLSSADSLMLLGLNEGSRATLNRYRRGEPIPQSRDLLERVSHLMGIHKNLRLLYPENQEMVAGWMLMRNKAFGGNRPLDVVRVYGLPGLLMVRAHLDSRRGE